MAVETRTEARPAYYRLRTPILSQGHIETVLAESDLMQVRIKSYAAGGENALHAHTGQDHTFVILQGRARFYDKDGNATEVGPREGVFLPLGAYYRFESCSDEPLIILRVAAKKQNAPAVPRVAPDGSPIDPRSAANKYVQPVYVEGAIWE